MSLSFVLDNRERAVNGLLPPEHNVSVQPLQLGDFQIRLDDEPVLIVERKTIPDLVASLRDGRYREQKARLLASGVKAAMVVEGGVEYFDTDAGNKAIISTIVNSALRDGIHVFVTQSVEETAGLLKGLMTRYTKDASRYVRPNNGNGSGDGNAAASSNDDYLSTRCIKSRRCENIDGDACFVMQLSSIPGLSHKKATALVDGLDVHNMGELLRVLDERGPSALSEVDGFGKLLSQTVLRFLVGKDVADKLEAKEAEAKVAAKAAAKLAAQEAKVAAKAAAAAKKLAGAEEKARARAATKVKAVTNATNATNATHED